MRTRISRIGFLIGIGLLTLGTVAHAQPANSKPRRANFRPQPENSAPEPAPRNLVLVGITQVGDRTQAWLMDTDSRTREIVSPGQPAFGFRVKSVDADRVVLTRGGRNYALRLGERQVPTVAAAPVRTAPPTISGRIPLPQPRMLPNVFAPPVFLTQEPDLNGDVELVPPSIPDPRDRLDNPNPGPNVDPRLFPDIYPGYGAMGAYGMAPGYPFESPYGFDPNTGIIPGYAVAPGYGMVPGYGMAPGYGFDPQAAGLPYGVYPTYPDGALGYPEVPYAYSGMAPAYPGYFGGGAPDTFYPYGSPYRSATTWGSPYAGYSPYVGNGLDMNVPRWSRQSGRRQNVDPFRGEITVNPQTIRRRSRFSFPVQGP